MCILIRRARWSGIRAVISVCTFENSIKYVKISFDLDSIFEQLKGLFCRIKLENSAVEFTL